VLRVEVRPWVVTDVSRVLGPTGRLLLDHILLDLNTHLPSNLRLYQPNRTLGGRCFTYDRIYVVNAGTLQGFSFVVRDADPTVLDVRSG
jgi:hypothetical protein